MISMSKIKKITAIKKKCNENDTRVYDIGLNPHSNGVHFCISVIVFFLIIINNIINTIIRKNVTAIALITIIIIQFLIDHLSWKLNILYILIEYINLIIFLISILKCIKIITQHLQNVNIMLLLQTLHDDISRNVLCMIELI